MKHRIVMPAMSRLRAQWPEATPTGLMRAHYEQRASDGGLIIAESTAVASEGRAYHAAPGIWNDDQVMAWRPITEAVHSKGGFMFVQLGHAGRASSELISGIQPITASVDPLFLQNERVVVTTPDGLVKPSAHRELDAAGIAAVVRQYRSAAMNALRAGFDGIEIFAAQGHLIEQFLQDGSNKRSDRYGGSLENRSRLLLEVVDAVASVVGLDRTGVRISPSSTFNGMSDSNPRSLFRHVAKRLDDANIAYLHIIEPRISGADTVDENQDAIAAKDLRQVFQGSIIAAGGFSPASAEAVVSDGVADLVSFGRYFTSNPDLPRRVAQGVPLAAYDRSTFYSGGATGYLDP